MSIIFSITIGHRMMAGTMWPIEHYMERNWGYGSKSKPWRVVWSCCNGVPTGSANYRTKKEALAAIEEAVGADRWKAELEEQGLTHA